MNIPVSLEPSYTVFFHAAALACDSTVTTKISVRRLGKTETRSPGADRWRAVSILYFFSVSPSKKKGAK